MKKLNCFFILTIFMVTLLAYAADAQTNYTFGYNARGHRITRTSILLKSATLPSDTVLAKELSKPLEDLIGLQKTIIYPNPTKGLLRIELPAISDQEAFIKVFDSGGRIVIQKRAVESSNEVDLSTHPSGFYILCIQIGRDNRKEWKIIKE